MSSVWEPKRTWAFIVGLLEWKHSDIYDSFPKEERRDAQLVKLLVERGVPNGQIVYLQDRKATTAAITSGIAEHLAAAPAGSTVIVYYCGHGWKADAVAAHPRRVAYASLASSLASELSTGNWTFTEAILAALRGDDYTDDDGSATITLAELAVHIQAEMAFAEEQVATFATSRGFDPQLVLAAARPRHDPQIGQQVAVQAEGTWWRAQITDVRGGKLKVRYYGYTSEHDDWVKPEQIRTSGRPRYPIGSTVEVKWKNRWHLATVLDERAGVHCVAYEGYGPDSNEWVSSTRIRPLI
jgi:hypothetical protein